MVREGYLCIANPILTSTIPFNPGEVINANITAGGMHDTVWNRAAVVHMEQNGQNLTEELLCKIGAPTNNRIQGL